ncbi:MAG: glycoside hydrolase family 88 protein [Acidobacteriia bacterium]|nr:glycoside hydrolase family 88 protein [Terriglobia bacterium]
MKLLLICLVAECVLAASPDQVLAVMHKVNNWQVAHPVMPAGDRNWERGTWYTGVMSAWKETHDRKFLDQALAWGRQHEWQVGTEPGGANRLFCAETWLELYFVKNDRAMIEPAIEWLNTNAPNSPAGAKRWYLEAWGLNRTYADSLYGAPALAMLARATQDKKYLDIMQAFFDDVTGELLDKESGLYYRDARFIGRRTANGKKILWSRGNGWVFAAIARILEYLPGDHPSRPEYVRIFRRMASELVKRQGADGLWRVNLDDPETVPEPETSGSGFFCYGLAWGIHHGVLERSTYLPAVLRAWAGLSRNVSPEGRPLRGQQVDFEPNAVKQDSTREFVTGTFLLAGSQVYALSTAE